MPEQLLLPGFTAPPKSDDNLFLALFPTTGVAACIAQLAHELRSRHGLRRRPLATDRFHVSLMAFDPRWGGPETIARGVSKAVAAVAALEVPFEIRFDRVGSFARRGGDPPLVLRSHDDNPALIKFHQHLRTALGARGNPGFTPHLTLLYDRQSVADEPVDPVGWTVNEFILVHSFVGQTRYARLARWTLGGS